MMTHSLLHELADEARRILARNPVSPTAESLDRTAARASASLHAEWLTALSRASDALGPDTALSRMSTIIAAEGDSAFVSYCLKPWMDGVRRGLDWMEIGAEPDIMRHFLAPDEVATDLLAERDPVRRLASGIGLVPVEAIARSRRLSDRVGQALPDYAPEGYPPCNSAALDAIVAHLDAAVEFADRNDPNGGRLLRSTVRTLHVGIRLDPLCSFSSANALPCSAFAVLSRQRLAEGDVAATAAQLMHEVGHVLLGIHARGARPGFSEEQKYVSPYKNDVQTLESIIHMGYTIPWECALRLTALPEIADESRRACAASFIIAYAARQSPIQVILSHALETLDPPVLAQMEGIANVPAWSSAILDLVERLLDAEPAERRAKHMEERRGVWRRQADDVGQMLLRGGDVADPGIDSGIERASSEEASFVYRGERRHIVRRTYAATGKDYGAYTSASIRQSELQP